MREVSIGPHSANRLLASSNYCWLTDPIMPTHNLIFPLWSTLMHQIMQLAHRPRGTATIYKLVVMDLFTKCVEAFPLQFTESTMLATVLVDEIVCHYGVPTVIHCDQGANLILNPPSTSAYCLAWNAEGPRCITPRVMSRLRGSTAHWKQCWQK